MTFIFTIVTLCTGSVCVVHVKYSSVLILEEGFVYAQLDLLQYIDFALNKHTPVFANKVFGKEIYCMTQPTVNLPASHCSFVFIHVCRSVQSDSFVMPANLVNQTV